MAKLYYIQVEDSKNNSRYYKVTSEYLREKLLNNNKVKISSQDQIELRDDYNLNPFLRKLFPGFIMSQIVISASYVSNLITSSMEQQYIEDFECLLVTQRTHWLSIIFLFYCEKITIGFINDFVKEVDYTTRAEMLISKLNSNDNNFIDPYECMSRDCKKLVNDSVPYSRYFNKEIDTRGITSLSNSLMYSSRSIETVFPNYYIFESCYSCFSYWNSASLAWAWANILRSKDPYVNEWNMEGVLNGWERFWDNCKGVLKFFTVAGIVSIFIAGINKDTLISNMRKPHKKFFEQRKRDYRISDYKRYYCSKYFVDSASALFSYDTYRNSKRSDDLISKPTRKKNANGFMWSFNGSNPNYSSFVGGAPDRLTAQPVRGIPYSMVSEYNEIEPKMIDIESKVINESIFESKPEYINKFMSSLCTQSGYKIVDSDNYPVKRVDDVFNIAQKVFRNRSFVEEQFKSIKSKPVFFRAIPFARYENGIVINADRYISDFGQLDDAMENISREINMQDRNYSFTQDKFIGSADISSQKDLFLECFRKIIAKIKEKQNTDNLSERLFYMVFADLAEGYHDFLKDDYKTRFDEFKIKPETFKLYRFLRIFYFMFALVPSQIMKEISAAESEVNENILWINARLNGTTDLGALSEAWRIR